MKSTFFTLVFALLAAKSFAQKTDFDRVVQPVEMKSKDFTEYLVQLAWMNNPANASLQNRKKIAEQEIKLAKKDWLNTLGVSGGVSRQPVVITEPIFNPGNPNQVISFNPVLTDERVTGVSGGVNFAFGQLFSTKNKAEAARQRVEIAQNEIDQQKLEVRAETLRRYQGFKLALEILKARAQLEQDSKSAFDLVTQQYRNDERTFKDYNEASTAYHQAVEGRIKAESEVQVARISLEEIVGAKWDEINHPQKDR